ncbi:10388_t:CDS:1, partial [Racocetra persica]
SPDKMFNVLLTCFIDIQATNVTQCNALFACHYHSTNTANCTTNTACLVSGQPTISIKFNCTLEDQSQCGFTCNDCHGSAENIDCDNCVNHL